MNFKCILLALLLMLSACSSRRPILYPNEAFRAESKETIEHEVERCMTLAKTYTGDPDIDAAKDTAVDSTILSAVGAVTGTAIGAVTGNIGQGAAIGAITGASGGVTSGVLRRNDRYNESGHVYRNFVERCLAERGLETIGWR